MELFRILATAPTPEVRQAAGHALSVLWARDELLHFGDHNSRWEAAATPSDEWNHAVGAAIVTSILNFQDRPSAIAFTNFCRRDLHRSLGEDVSG